MQGKPKRGKPRRRTRRPLSKPDITHLRRSGRYVSPSRLRWRNELKALNKAPIAWLEKRCVEPLANLFENADLFRIFEKLGFLIAILVFLIEVGERREKSIFEAWQVVKDGQGEKSGVVVLALERLKKENFSLSGINVKNTNLIKADLSGANLIEADLSGANLARANLSSTDLGGANLIKANLVIANLSSANLFRANLSSANLFDAILSSADLSDSNLSGARLSTANLGEADLSGAKLIGAKLINADLVKVNLREADLSSAKLIGANLFRADLSDANLFRANLRGANLSGTNLSGANNLAPTQVKSPRYWEEAKYSPDFRRQLGLPAETRLTPGSSKSTL